MTVNMVAPTHPTQFESECFDQPTELGKPDVPNVTTEKALPQIISAGARHVWSELSRSPYRDVFDLGADIRFVLAEILLEVAGEAAGGLVIGLFVGP
jgi:hypothetical protein